MNFLTCGYGLFIILMLSEVIDFSDSVVIGTAILIGCLMISENLADIKNEIKENE